MCILDCIGWLEVLIKQTSPLCILQYKTPPYDMEMRRKLNPGLRQPFSVGLSPLLVHGRHWCKFIGLWPPDNPDDMLLFVLWGNRLLLFIAGLKYLPAASLNNPLLLAANYKFPLSFLTSF